MGRNVVRSNGDEISTNLDNNNEIDTNEMCGECEIDAAVGVWRRLDQWMARYDAKCG